MSPAWIAPALMAAGAGCLAFAAFALGPVRAAEQPPAGRQWAIERCHGDDCRLLEWRYSGATSCNVDLASVANTAPSAMRLACVRIGETKR